LARKTEKASALSVILFFTLAASIIVARSTGTAYADSRPTIPFCTLDIVAYGTGATLHLTNDTIADYIQAGHLTELSGIANMTKTNGNTYMMDQYKGVSLLDLINLVCDLNPNSVVWLNSSDGYKVSFNSTYITNGQVNTYTNNSALTYFSASGGWITTNMMDWTQVPHSSGETLTAILAYYVNYVNGGVNNGGPTSYLGWQGIGSSNGPLRNTVLGCANKHYTAAIESSKEVASITIMNPGTIHVPEFPVGFVLPAAAFFTAFAAFVAFRKRSRVKRINQAATE
jgi:hypothetical protein